MSDEDEILQRLRLQGRSNLMNMVTLHLCDVLLPMWVRIALFLFVAVGLDVTKKMRWNIGRNIAAFIFIFSDLSDSVGAYRGLYLYEVIMMHLVIRNPTRHLQASSSPLNGLRRRSRILTTWLFIYTTLASLRKKTLLSHLLRAPSILTMAVITAGTILWFLYTRHKLRYLGLLARGITADLWAGCGFAPLGNVPFKYANIKNPREIRLLVVPGRNLITLFYDPFLHLEIIHVPLYNPPPYEAMSHVWGDVKKTCRLYANGYPLEVSESVHSMLQSCRALLISRLVWIDSISINQNNKEKSEQIQLMRDIFHQAVFVVCYFGQPNDGQLAFRMLWHQYQALGRETSGQKLYEIFSQAEWSQHLKAVADLLSMPWLQRVWIVQEVAVAKDLVLRYGLREITWQDFMGLVNFLDRHQPILMLVLASVAFDQTKCVQICEGIGNAKTMEDFQQRVRTGKLVSPLHTLRMGSVFNSTMPRDKIYGLLGLFPRTKTTLPLPDYSRKTDREVFTEYAVWLLSDEDSLSILHDAGIGQARNQQSLPSWVPDWTSGLSPKILRLGKNFSASLSSRQQGLRILVSSTASCPYTLRLRGFLVDSITYMSSLNPSVPNLIKDCVNGGIAVAKKYPPISHPSQSALSLASTHARHCYDTDRSFKETFWRTMIAGLDGHSWAASIDTIKRYRIKKETSEMVQVCTNLASQGRIDEIVSLYPDIDSDSEGDIRHEEIDKWRSTTVKPGSGLSVLTPPPYGSLPSLYDSEIERHQVRRGFCITGNGSMGLVPELSKPGDKVAILLGLETPCILRSKGGDGGPARGSTYEFVGTCYMHGMMEGEMMARKFEEQEFVIV